MEKYINITIQNTNWKGTTKQYKNKSKTYRGYYSQLEHNRRTEENMEEDYLVNDQFTKLNMFEDYLEEEEIHKELEQVKKDYKKHHNRKLPKNFKPFTNGIITFSNTIQKDLELLTNKDNRKEFFKVIKGFLEEEVGTLISLDFHLDETTPHFHFMSVNYNYEQHITYSRLITNGIKENERVNKQQDRLEKYLQDNIKGWDYKRGKIQSREEYNKKRKKYSHILQDMEDRIEEFEEDIEHIEEILLEEDKINDLDKFRILLQRYGKSENSINKLEKLIKKWTKSTSKIRDKQKQTLSPTIKPKK